MLEAQYWAATKQLPRVRTVDEALASFTDHRDVWFEPAYQTRLQLLTDTTGKSQEQIDKDAKGAIALLDQLLALPIERNLPLVSRRIALAIKFEDVEFLSSAGWIIARKIRQLPANAPQQSKTVFGKLLGSMFAPYASNAADGSLRISNPRMAELYRDLSGHIGTGSIVIPDGR